MLVAISVNNWSTVSRQLVNSWLTVGQQSVDSWLTVGQHTGLAICQQILLSFSSPIPHRNFAITSPMIHRVSVDYQSIYRLIVGFYRYLSKLSLNIGQ